MTVSLQASLQEALGDRYVVEDEVGRGGMATVFRATDLKHARPVALKVLHPSLAQTLGAERFLREIEILAGLTHPHILPLYDSGSAAGLLFYVMPYVEGETLRARMLRESRLPVDEALDVACDVARALDYAHRRGVVHRDVKPENVLLGDGHAVVADFGVARAVGRASVSGPLPPGATAFPTTIGTPAYMSPEQATGDAVVDGRSDVYSLGCMLYEMLAGVPAFPGSSTQAVVARRFAGPPAPLRTVRADVPPAVAAAVEMSLAADPVARFTTAAEFAEALQSTGRPTPVRASSAIRERAAALRAQWTRWMSVAVVLAVAVVAAALLIER